MVAYENIDVNHSIGASVNDALKGTAQLSTKVIDQTMSEQLGAVDLIVTGIVVSLIAFLFVKANEAKEHGQNLF